MLNSADRVGLNLSEYIGQGDWRLFFLNRDRIRKATVEDVQKAAAAYLKPSNRTLGVFLPTAKPDRSEIPPPVDAAAAVKDYKGDAAMAAGEAFDPSPANIEARTKRSELPNGMKVALLSKKTRGGTVVATLTVRFGDEKTLFGKSTVADLAGRHAHARHDEAHAPADQGRARPLEGPRGRLGPRDPGQRWHRDDAREPARRPARSPPRSCASRRSRPRSSRSSSSRTSPPSSSSAASPTRSPRTTTSGT